jgi:hypothetical protein
VRGGCHERNEFSKLAKEFKKKLENTRKSSSFFVFVENKDMYEKDTGSENYVFYDILCDQYFQESKHDIDIEHIINASNLKYFVDYAISFGPGEIRALGNPNKTDLFNFFLSIFEFALESHFSQVRVTHTCNRSIGNKQRRNNTINQYMNILEFVCKLYYCKENKTDGTIIFDEPPKEDCVRIHPYDISEGMEKMSLGQKEISIQKYISLMHENSQKKYENTDTFKEFPTIIVPKTFQDEETMITEEDNPLKKNYDYVCNIGEYWRQCNLDINKITEIIKIIIGTPEDQSRRIMALDLYKQKVNQDFSPLPTAAFGAIPIISNFKELPLRTRKTSTTKNRIESSQNGLPSDIGYRMKKLNNLLYDILPALKCVGFLP